MSDSEVGAVVEVLQDLRQDASAIGALDNLEGEGDDHDAPAGIAIVRDCLQSRYLATLLPTNPDEFVVAIDQGATRSYIESRGLGQSLKIGDFIGTDRALSRATSRLLYDDTSLGLCAPSAEHHPSLPVATFETHSVSGRVRLSVTVLSTDLALTFGPSVTAAAQYLGLLPPTSASAAPVSQAVEGDGSGPSSD